jgi:hypothetical protein
MRTIAAVLALVLAWSSAPAAAAWPPARSPAIPEADGYVEIPGAAVAPDKSRTYRAVFDATQAAAKPTELVPALNMAGSELNALAAAGVPLAKAKFAVVFHGTFAERIGRFFSPTPAFAALFTSTGTGGSKSKLSPFGLKADDSQYCRRVDDYLHSQILAYPYNCTSGIVR